LSEHQTATECKPRSARLTNIGVPFCLEDDAFHAFKGRGILIVGENPAINGADVSVSILAFSTYTEAEYQDAQSGGAALVRERVSSILSKWNVAAGAGSLSPPCLPPLAVFSQDRMHLLVWRELGQ
jgi:hypothetical protein